MLTIKTCHAVEKGEKRRREKEGGERTKMKKENCTWKDEKEERKKTVHGRMRKKKERKLYMEG